MKIDHNTLINELLDLYASLLTPYQIEIMEYYYKEDLSLKEISEIKGISRNAVHSLIKRVDSLLLEYESKMKLNEKIKKIADFDMEAELKAKLLDILLKGE